jgi:hypothetical protein
MEETTAPSCSSCTNGASKIQDPEVAGFKATTTEEPQRFSDFCDCRVQCILCDIQEGGINDVGLSLIMFYSIFLKLESYSSPRVW